MGMMDPKFRAALLAVDVLNEWVRSSSFEKTYGRGVSPKAAIYFLKNLAMDAACVSKAADFRRVRTLAPCHACQATGKSGMSAYAASIVAGVDKCEWCGGTGKRTLEFVETVVSGVVRWYTPADKWGFSWGRALPVEDVGPEVLTPGLPGRNAAVSEVARCLNLAEAFFPGQLPRYRIFDYRLHIGETNPAKCCLCGDAVHDGGVEMPSLRHPVVWRLHYCRHCEPVAADVPPELLADPHVAEWVMKHTLGTPGDPAADVGRCGINGY
jgi:hypothetical protein